MRVAIGVCQFLVAACCALQSAHSQSFVDCTVTATTPPTNPDHWGKYSILFRDEGVGIVVFQPEKGERTRFGEAQVTMLDYESYRPGLSVHKQLRLDSDDDHVNKAEFDLAEVKLNKAVTLDHWEWAVTPPYLQMINPMHTQFFKTELQCSGTGASAHK